MPYDKFDVRAISVGGLFRENEFVVPKYQRGYAWGNEEIDALWNDLEAAIQRNDPDYFLGTTVFVKDPEDTKRSTVIDGQQRLATLTILLAVLRDILEELNSSQDANDLHGLIKRRYLGRESLVVTLGSRDEEEFRRYVQARLNDSERVSRGTKRRASGRGRPSRAHIRNAYDRLFQKANEYTEGLSEGQAAEKLITLGRYASENLVIAGVFVPSDEDAYIIFESVNARGLGLSIADLVKNHLFTLASRQKSLQRVESLWDELVDFIDPGSLDRFLRYHWLSQHEVVTQRRLYRTIKVYLGGSRSRADSFIQELVDSALIYQELLQPGSKDPEAATLRQLNEIGVTQQLPFLMACKERLDARGFARAVHLVESMYVRYLLVGGQNPNVLEGYYSQWAKQIRDGQPIAEIGHKAKSFLSDQIKGSLKENLVGLNQLTVPQARYLLRKFNEKLHGPTELDWSNTTVEHIIPRKPTKEWQDNLGIAANEIQDWVRRLGNITLLDEGLNIGASNRPFDQKRQKYEESKFDLTRSVAKDATWDTNNVIQRERQFAEVADQIWVLEWQ
ncbi:MAG: DUF262 domain-containing protein [Dehalococcoidia bacterium]